MIPSVDDLLYEIGLCLTSVRDEPKRKAISDPKLITIVLWLYLIARIASLLIPESNEFGLLLVGDVGRYMGIKLYFNVLLILPI